MRGTDLPLLSFCSRPAAAARRMRSVVGLRRARSSSLSFPSRFCYYTLPIPLLYSNTRTFSFFIQLQRKREKKNGGDNSILSSPLLLFLKPSQPSSSPSSSFILHNPHPALLPLATLISVPTTSSSSSRTGLLPLQRSKKKEGNEAKDNQPPSTLKPPSFPHLNPSSVSYIYFQRVRSTSSQFVTSSLCIVYTLTPVCSFVSFVSFSALLLLLPPPSSRFPPLPRFIHQRSVGSYVSLSPSSYSFQLLFILLKRLGRGAGAVVLSRLRPTER